MAGEPVDTENGAQVINHSILKVKGAQDLELAVSYNSLCLSNDVAGLGWSHNYEARIQTLASTNVLLVWTANKFNQFTSQLGNPNLFRCSDLTCIYHTLTRHTDGTFTLLEPSQRQLQFDNLGRLQQVVSPHRQAIQLNYAASSFYPTQMVEVVSGRAFSLSYNASPNLLAQVSDDLGRTVTFSYDSSNRLTQITKTYLATSQTYRFGYDSAGRVLSETNPEGFQVFTNTYDPQGRVWIQRDASPMRLATFFSYDESLTNTLITAVVDRTAAVTRYVYNRNYLLQKKIDPLGNVTTYGYDTNGNRTATTNALGQAQRFGFDAAGNLVSITDAAGQTTRFQYDTHNNLIATTNAAGSVATFGYDSNNNLTNSVDFLTNVVSMAYDGNSLLKQNTSPRGGKTSFAYNGGLPLLATDAMTNSTGMAYDVVGRLIAVTNGAGFVTTNAYDLNDHLVATADGLGNLWRYTYDSAGRALSVTDPLSNRTTFVYNGNGDLTAKTDALGHSITYTYDGEERLLSTTDANGNIRSRAYDSAGRLISVTDGLGHATSFQYDSVGNVVGTVDALGVTQQTTTYDVRNKPIVRQDALGYSRRMAYDSLERVVQTVDPPNRTNTFGYDAVGHLITSTDPLSLQTAQRFDADGNRSTIFNPKQAQFGFQHDLGDRVTLTTSPMGKVTRFTYDARSFVTNVVAPSGAVTSMSYDGAGHLAAAQDLAGTLAYGYDKKGRLVTVTENSATVIRQYDALDRLTNYTDSVGNVLQYMYDNVGNLTKLIYPDGKIVTYAYDAANRMTAVIDWEGRKTTYEYDADNRLTKTTLPNGTVSQRMYDVAGRLVQQTDSAPQGALVCQVNYAFDSAGQIIGEFKQPTIAASGQTSVSMSYDADNALVSYAGQAVTNDANGNMVYGPLWSGFGGLSYDVRNRLTGAGGLSYRYDPAGNRVAITNGGNVTQCVVNPNASLSQVLMRTQAGVINFYVYGLGLVYEVTPGGSTSKVLFYHHDCRGSTVALTDGSGNVTDRMAYSPYGGIMWHNGTNNTPFLYNGSYGVTTESSGLLCMRARFYNSLTARFISQDAVPGRITRHVSLNKYAYAANNPVIGADPTGFDVYLIGVQGGPSTHVGLAGMTASMSRGIAFDPDALRRGNWGGVIGGYQTVSVGGGVGVDAGFSGGVEVGRAQVKGIRQLNAQEYSARAEGGALGRIGVDISETTTMVSLAAEAGGGASVNMVSSTTKAKTLGDCFGPPVPYEDIMYGTPEELRDATGGSLAAIALKIQADMDAVDAEYADSDAYDPLDTVAMVNREVLSKRRCGGAQ